MHSPDVRQGEPRWPAMVALLAVSALCYALPPTLKVGPDWMFLLLVAALTVPGAVSHSVRRLPLTRIFGYAASSILTLAMIGSLGLLVSRLPLHKESPSELL